MNKWSLGMMLVLVVVVIFGCSTPPARDFHQARVSSTSAQSTLEAVNDKIEKATNRKKNMEEYACAQRAGGFGMEEFANIQRSVGESHKDSADRADHHFAQVVATEAEIVRINKQLEKLEDEKKRILTETMGCFPPDTLVFLEDGSTKPFAEIVVGDLVMTYDIGHEVLVGKPVVDLYSLVANHLYTINGALKTTGGERLLTQDGWKTVRNLNVGDVVHVNGYMVGIDSIRIDRVALRVVNMQVADTHNFYVQTSDGSKYLVHNSGGGGGGGGK